MPLTQEGLEDLPTPSKIEMLQAVSKHLIAMTNLSLSATESWLPAVEKEGGIEDVYTRLILENPNR